MANDHKSPHEIEREIERERAELAHTVDELQDRFSPDRIFREVSQGFREHGSEIGHAITRSVKENPVALALTGVGLAWLMMGRSGNRRSADTDTYRADSTVEHDHNDRSQEDYRSRENYRHPANQRLSGVYGHNFEEGFSKTRSTYRDYPKWARDDDDTTSTGDRVSATASSFVDGAKSGAASVSDAAKAAGSSVKSGARAASNSVSSAAGTAADTAKEAAQRLQDGARSAADRAARMRERLARGTEHLSEAARDRVVAARQRAVEMRDRAERSAWRNYYKGKAAASDFFEEQPLVTGALAMAVGAALAGALPRSEREDEIFGQYRDDLFDEAERIFEEESRKAKRVAQAAMDEASNIAEEKRREADSAAPGKMSAVETAADEVRSAAGRVADKAKSEAEKQKLGKPET